MWAAIQASRASISRAMESWSGSPEMPSAMLYRRETLCVFAEVFIWLEGKGEDLVTSLLSFLAAIRHTRYGIDISAEKTPVVENFIKDRLLHHTPLMIQETPFLIVGLEAGNSVKKLGGVDPADLPHIGCHSQLPITWRDDQSTHFVQ